MGLDAGRLEDFGGEVPAEGSPERAVDGGVYVVLVARYDSCRGESERTVGENGAVLDESFVGEFSVGDPYGRF